MVVTKTSQDGRHEARVFAWQWAFCSASSLRCTRCVPVKTTPSFIYLEKPGKNRLLENQKRSGTKPATARSTTSCTGTAGAS